MRKVLAAISAVMLAAMAGFVPAYAADYPSKPIRLIVPYPPGAGVDGSARIVADALSARLGQQVVVENKPRASGTIGADYVAKSIPDGYTLLWCSTDAVSAVPAVKQSMPYKVPDDFTYIAKFAETGMAFVVSSKLPVTSLAELIAYGKANPEKIRYGTSGVGGLPHLATLLFDKYAGIKMTHVPYKGVAPALADLLGGHIEFALLTPITIVSQLGSDKMRVIGITAPTRSPLLPNAPTIKEAGLPQATAIVWYGMLGPAKLPAPVLERLRTELAAIAGNPAIKEKLETVGLQLSPQFGEEFERSAVAEYNQWKAIVAAENIVVRD